MNLMKTSLVVGGISVFVIAALDLVPSFPATFENAVVQVVECEEAPWICENTGLLERDITGTYRMQVREDAFLEFSKANLVTQNGNTFVFSDVVLRQNTVVVSN